MRLRSGWANESNQSGFKGVHLELAGQGQRGRQTRGDLSPEEVFQKWVQNRETILREGARRKVRAKLSGLALRQEV